MTDHRFVLRAGEQVVVFADATSYQAGIPIIEHVRLPMATAETKPWYEACHRFGPYNHHPGKCEDFNLETGGDSDLGEEIVAPFAGVVLANTNLRGGIGPVVQVMGITHSDVLYVWAGWHLEESDRFGAGKIVQAGEHLGTVGNCGGRYAAHLHMQVCRVVHGSGIPAPWVFPSDGRYEWLQPSAFFVDMGVDRDLVRQCCEFDGRPSPADLPVAQCLNIRTPNPWDPSNWQV
jgi:hypothetical protein